MVIKLKKNNVSVEIAKTNVDKDSNNKKVKKLKSVGLLPIPSPVVYICGRAGSGKSQLLQSIFTAKGDNKLFRKFFNHIEVFSPSLASFDKNPFSIPDDQIHPEYIEEEVEELYDNLDKEYKNAFIIDDCIAEINNSKTSKKLIFNHRHKNLSVFITSQAYIELAKRLRDNINVLIMFETNIKNWNFLNEEKLNLPQEKLEQLIDFVFDAPYTFLIISLGQPTKNNRSGIRYFKNFDEFKID